MKTISTETRKVQTNCGEIVFKFERKSVKNINLRIRNNGKVCVSAPKSVPKFVIDSFVISKSEYIKRAIDKFKQSAIPKANMQYVSGENVTFLGKNMRLNIVKDSQEYVNTDGIYVFIHVKRPDYYNRKKNLFNNWLDEQCNLIFNELVQEVYKKFRSYNVILPQIKLRNMTTRWGSCLPEKSIITLNKRLIEAPKPCIKYVVYHEFCHFIHPNHSKQFYSLLQIMLPNWRSSKQMLESSVVL